MDPLAPALADSAAYRDTIGSMAYYEGMGGMAVRGYGVVVGLGDKGTSECPKPIFDRLVESLHKQHAFIHPRVGVYTPTPEELIRDVDTAVVTVEGTIPPGAVAGTTFDVTVTALPGTNVKSLKGGRLFTTDLMVYRAVAPTVAMTGRAMARASGPLFINPFSTDGSATQANVLQGTILGGGEVLEDRRMRLVLPEPSYRVAKRIQDRINARFSSHGAAAVAQSPSYVQLQVPEAYHDDIGHFLELVRHLYLRQDAQFDLDRALALVEEIKRPSAPHADIALCFEGLGQAALPHLEELYSYPKEYVSFHAAVAGMRLGDYAAIDALAAHARDARSAYRFPAIRALGEAHEMPGAGMTLRALLDDGDARARIAAYEALVAREDVSISTIQLGEDNFYLDVLPNTRAAGVYVKRTGERRIAVFGGDLTVQPPAFYRAPDGAITIQADEQDDQLMLLRTVPATRSVSPPIPCGLAVRELVTLMGEAPRMNGAAVRGLGLDYGEVARALQQLCADGSIRAPFILEQPNLSELFGPSEPQRRPESEL